MTEVGSVIVSWDFSNEKDKNIVLVGKRENNRINIINAFQGEEAEKVYKTLTERKREVSHE